MNPVSASDVRRVAPRTARFLQKPLHEKLRSFYFRWVRFLPGVPFPVRLPFGAWWLTSNDFLSASLFYDGFENRERKFVESFLRPGMTALDIGAHHGFYTLLASQIVGREGRVLAFEPSPRELRRLNLHLLLNGCRNVTVEAFALGDADATGRLFVAPAKESGFNSLRRPGTTGASKAISVAVHRLDDVLDQRGIERVDFIKMDVEGAELPILKGSRETLARRFRPVILAEVQDVRTAPWGYAAREIVRFLKDLAFRWYEPIADGGLGELDTEAEEYDGTFVAIPEERGTAQRPLA